MGDLADFFTCIYDWVKDEPLTAGAIGSLLATVVVGLIFLPSRIRRWIRRVARDERAVAWSRFLAELCWHAAVRFSAGPDEGLLNPFGEIVDRLTRGGCNRQAAVAGG